VTHLGHQPSGLEAFLSLVGDQDAKRIVLQSPLAETVARYSI
jgi:hypothetical protein